MGDVLVRTWNVLSRHLVTFLLLCFIAELPSLILSFVLPAQQLGRSYWAQLGVQLGTSIVHLVLSSLAQAMVVYAAFQDLRGRTVSAAESASHGLSQLVSVIGLSILVGIVVGIGMVLLIIPGLIAITALAVALPVCVVERDGPSSSMRRSANLTSGHRWPIFGVAFAVGVISIAVGYLIAVALGRTNTTTITTLTWVWTTILLSFQSVYAAILYHDLRATSEGIGVEEIAAVFD